MYEKEVDGRREVAITDIEALVPENHLVRKIEKVMDYEWIYERVAPYYSAAKNVRPGTDPVVLVKMVLLQHLFGIPSLRQTYQRACDTISYRWFLGYGLLDKLPHFATVSYAFCRRFPEELATEIFEHILNKALNNHMVDSSMIFIDGTHIKASANKKKYQKEQVAKAARVYAKRLREEVNEERAKLGKPPVEEEEDDDHGDGGTTEQAVSTTDPECGMYHKGEHEKQFAYEAHTVCDRHGMVLGVEVTAGNVHDSVAWDSVYEQVTKRFPDIQYVTMDAGYKQPWIAKRILEDNRIPILPYTRPHGIRRQGYMPWDFTYEEANDCLHCPQGQVLRHTTTSKDGKRIYRSTPKVCRNCPCREQCGASAKGQKVMQRHIWQEAMDLAEQLRKTELGKDLYAMRKQTIERVFADAKEKYAMRYTHHRGLARVTRWVTLKFAAMNLKKLAVRTWQHSFSVCFSRLFLLFSPIYKRRRRFA